MENGAYVSPPQLPPQAHLSAAAAFQAAAANSAAAGGAVTPFQEALMSRMGRPFGLTVRILLFLYQSVQIQVTKENKLDMSLFNLAKERKI